ncbi:hypothetical protein JHU04_004310 [Brenneria sp. 4F2]|nr:hypothetical protein [Brenneria bubanii]
MAKMHIKEIWVFNGAMARFPSGIFLYLKDAKDWIKENRLTGILTKYPVNKGVYDWAIENDLFHPNEDKHKSPSFIGSFTCASMEHFHFEDGVED